MLLGKRLGNVDRMLGVSEDQAAEPGAFPKHSFENTVCKTQFLKHSC